MNIYNIIIYEYFLIISKYYIQIIINPITGEDENTYYDDGYR